MKTLPIALLCLAACTVAMAELSPTQVEAKRSLEATAGMEEHRGSVFAQARLDGIGYQTILKRAIDLDQEALVALAGMKFVGEGGETHCAVLLQLMKLWGDHRFSKVVADQPAEVRDLVVGSIDYAWADPEWDRYPRTLNTAPGSITLRD